MVSPQVRRRQLFTLVALAVITFIALGIYFASGDDSPKDSATRATTTTTTLPPKDSQACEFLTLENLATGGIIPDVNGVSSDRLKRCTYKDIGGNINFITLYLDVAAQCPTIINGQRTKSPLPEVSASAIYSDDIDPTIIVTSGTRCFFVQGSKTLINKTQLTDIAKAVTALLVAVDTSTTTAPPPTGVTSTPNATLPGSNTTVVTTTST